MAIDMLRSIVESSDPPLTAPVEHLAERFQIVTRTRRALPSWVCGECPGRLEAETIAELNHHIAEHLRAHDTLSALGGT
jgi:hypothetical protein